MFFIPRFARVVIPCFARVFITCFARVCCSGGTWSAELDGPDPENNPQTLINTAIRNVKAQLGLDLSYCKTWYKICEVSVVIRSDDTPGSCLIGASTKHIRIFKFYQTTDLVHV